MKSINSLQTKIDRLKVSIEQLVETMRAEENPDVEDFFNRCNQRAHQSSGRALLDKIIVLKDYIVKTDIKTGASKAESETLLACPITISMAGGAGGFWVVCTEKLGFFKIVDRAGEILDLDNLDVMALEDAYEEMGSGSTGSLN